MVRLHVYFYTVQFRTPEALKVKVQGPTWVFVELQLKGGFKWSGCCAIDCCLQSLRLRITARFRA